MARWSRVLMFALLCALISSPGELRGRVCLVALGVIEDSSCCSAEPTCCDSVPESGPALNSSGEGCNCCVDVVLDSRGKLPLATVLAAAEIVAPVLDLVSELTPVPMPAPGLERTRAMLARERMRPAAAAAVPLRI